MQAQKRDPSSFSSTRKVRPTKPDGCIGGTQPTRSFSHERGDSSQMAFGTKRHACDSSVGKICQKHHVEPAKAQQAGRWQQARRCEAAGAGGWAGGCGQHRPTNSRWSRQSRAWRGCRASTQKAPGLGNADQRTADGADGAAHGCRASTQKAPRLGNGAVGPAFH
jgi:hypothetical protein